MSSFEATPATVDELSRQIGRTLALVDELIAAGGIEGVDAGTVNDLVTAAIRLFYVAVGERTDLGPDPESVSPSEALTLVSGLLAAHDVSTFDLALWLSRTRTR